jgi:hypothetical protein
MHQQQNTRQAERKPAPIKTETLTLIGSNGVKWDTVEIAAHKDLPRVVIWGTGTAQRCFLKDAGKVYKEVSWIFAAMPDFRPI